MSECSEGTIISEFRDVPQFDEEDTKSQGFVIQDEGEEGQVPGEYPHDRISGEGDDDDTTGSTAAPEVPIVKSKETIAPIDTAEIQPQLKDKFMERPVKAIIRHVMERNLKGQLFNVEKVRGWCSTVANEINEEVKDIGFKRYKHVVQVVMGELTGAGVKVGHKCLWNQDTDGFTSDFFMNESLYCVVIVFGAYFYG